MNHLIKLTMYGVMAGFGFDRRKCENCYWWEHRGKVRIFEDVIESKYGYCGAFRPGNEGWRMLCPGDEIGPRNDIKTMTHRNFSCKLWALSND